MLCSRDTRATHRPHSAPPPTTDTAVDSLLPVASPSTLFPRQYRHEESNRKREKEKERGRRSIPLFPLPKIPIHPPEPVCRPSFVILPIEPPSPLPFASCPFPHHSLSKVMNTIANSARSGWDRMTRAPSIPFGGHRTNVNGIQPHPPPFKRATTAPLSSPIPAPHAQVTLSFNVPFNSDLAGPRRDEVVYASLGAFDRWISPEGSDDKPVYDLPVHTQHRNHLEMLCEQITHKTNGSVRYFIRSGLPKPVAGMPPRAKAWVTNVCLRGPYEVIGSARQAILNQSPISLVGTEHCVYKETWQALTQS